MLFYFFFVPAGLRERIFTLLFLTKKFSGKRSAETFGKEKKGKARGAS